jgi:hypothetical protein
LATINPITKANVDTAMKYASARPVVRPMRPPAPDCAIPVATVKKMTGPITSLTNLMNASPNGFKVTATSGR